MDVRLFNFIICNYNNNQVPKMTGPIFLILILRPHFGSSTEFRSKPVRVTPALPQFEVYLMVFKNYFTLGSLLGVGGVRDSEPLGLFQSRKTFLT